MEYLELNDITDNIVIIKIRKLYKKGMTDLELYEATRGIWKRRIESVQEAEYCLAVAKKEVVEVYKINQWFPAGTIPMTTRSLDPSHFEKRIEFVGEVAEDSIRDKYIGKFTDHLFKNGEASPVKTFFVK